MGGHAAARGQDAFGSVHAVNVLRRGLDPHQDDLAAGLAGVLGLVRVEDDLARGGAGRGRQARCQHAALGLGVDHRVQELVERTGLDAADGLLLRDQAFLREFDRDPQRRLGGALAGAGLQHPELALLDGEFHVLHVAVMLFEDAVDPAELGIGLRHRLLHGRLVGAGFLAGGLGDVLRGADAGDDIFALRIDQELAVKSVLAGRRVACEGDAGGRGVAHIAEDHRLDIHRRAPGGRDVVELAILDRARIHPGGEDGADRAPELVARVLREVAAKRLLHDVLVLADEDLPVLGAEIGVEMQALALLVILERLLEMPVIDVEHDVGIHRDEAAIAVPGEAGIARGLGHRLDGDVVQAEIEDRVHHARHRGAGARAHRDEQRIGGVAEGLAGQAAHLGQRGLRLRLEIRRELFAVVVIPGADLGGDGEAGRHRQAEIAHLGQVCPLAAEQVLHARLALGLAIAEGVDPLPASHRPSPFTSSRPRTNAAADEWFACAATRAPRRGHAEKRMNNQ